MHPSAHRTSSLPGNILLLLLLSTSYGHAGDIIHNNDNNHEIHDNNKIYHNQFAVHIPAGASVAASIASKHGLHNLGQIGNLENYFLFEARRIHKRSLSPSVGYAALLEEEYHITWMQQQQEKRRVKRHSSDYSIPSNTPDISGSSRKHLDITSNSLDSSGSSLEHPNSLSNTPDFGGSRLKHLDDSPNTHSVNKGLNRLPLAKRTPRVRNNSIGTKYSREGSTKTLWEVRKKRELEEMRDPLFHNQWFLNHGARDGSDMNVKRAWEMGITGKQVVVTILDDGIQYDHPDLKQNYDPLASKDINDNDDDPMPQDNGDNKHGTRCAGEVAATAFNEFCGVGIAYNASIGGVRMLDGMVNDAVEARSLSLNPNHIDIYSASWGPEDDGKTVDGPGPLAKQAFINGITSGRGGKGSIFVWASGNGGHHTDNCNCDGYTNSIFTLSISSATQGGFKPWYLEQCSSTLATTYSSGTPGQDASITTVDQDKSLRPGHICTSSHTGTSASAPLAAGVCALALEANPSLSWRDMQHIVVLTSNPGPLMHEKDWDKNSLGRKFSHKFGFGLMDAFELVKMAKKWKPVEPQHICETRVEVVDKVLPWSTNMRVNVTLITDGCDNMLSKVGFLEHVQCKISLKYSPRGQLKIALRSPRGTKSFLLFGRPKDKFASSFDDWPFLSVHFWGEDPTGQWTLEITNTGSKDATSDGILKHWQLVLYGTENSPIKHLNPPSTNSSPASSVPVKSSGHEANGSITNLPITLIRSPPSLDVDTSVPRNPLRIIGCHENCLGGCFGPAASQCNSCKQFRYKGQCRKACPVATYPSIPRITTTNSASNFTECHPCHYSCGNCFGPGSTSCSSCLNDDYLLSDQSTCLSKCPAGYLVDHKTHSCSLCPSPCSTCQPSYNHTDCEWCKFFNAQCTQCPPDLTLYHGECIASCPATHFVSSENKTHRCVACHPNCSSCVGPRDTQCGLCQEGTFYFERRCVPYCPVGYIASLDLRECLACSRGCDSCPGEAGKCKVCQSGWELTTEGACQPEASRDCQPGMYKSNYVGSCLACHKSCRTCSGPRHTDCSACYPDHRLHISSCVEICPPSSYPAPTTHTCLSCPHSCATCQDQRCTSCKSGYHLLTGRCVISCGSGMFSDQESVCTRCHTSCQECKGPGSNLCVTCDSSKGLILVDGKCLPQCPLTLYLSPYLSKDVPLTCSRCHNSCNSCSNVTKCLTCPDNKMLEDGHCISCDDNYLYSASLRLCIPCHESCTSCIGPDSTHCLTCHDNLQLDTWSHTCVPCCTSYQDHLPCCLCGSSGVCTTTTKSMMSMARSTSFTGLVLTVAGGGAAVAAVIFVINTVRNGRKERMKRGKVYSKLPGGNKDEILLISQNREEQSENESTEEDEESQFLVVD